MRVHDVVPEKDSKMNFEIGSPASLLVMRTPITGDSGALIAPGMLWQLLKLISGKLEWNV